MSSPNTKSGNKSRRSSPTVPKRSPYRVIPTGDTKIISNVQIMIKTKNSEIEMNPVLEEPVVTKNDM